MSPPPFSTLRPAQSPHGIFFICFHTIFFTSNFFNCYGHGGEQVNGDSAFDWALWACFLCFCFLNTAIDVALLLQLQPLSWNLGWVLQHSNIRQWQNILWYFNTLLSNIFWTYSFYRQLASLIYSVEHTVIVGSWLKTADVSSPNHWKSLSTSCTEKA